jgi:hypothetical protein
MSLAATLGSAHSNNAFFYYLVDLFKSNSKFSSNFINL